MKRLLTTLLLTSIATAALAQAPQPQPQPDPVFLQNALNAVMKQRDSALNAQAGVEAQLAGQIDQNAKLKARIDELEKQAKDAPAAPPAQ